MLIPSVWMDEEDNSNGNFISSCFDISHAIIQCILDIRVYSTNCIKCARSSDCFLQALPQDTSPIVFTSQIKQLNTGEVFFLPQPQISQYRQAPAQFRQVPKQFRKQEFRTTTEFQQQQPAFQQQGQQFRQQPAIQQQQPTFAASSSARIQTAPAGQFEPQYSRQEVYGPPPAPAPLPAEAPEPEQPGNEPPVNGENDDDNDDTNDGPVIAVANASTNGQYYILTKDNTLQRVVYQTAQTEDDIINNGFTAQLRYAPVEPIRDPIYAYNTQGQLVKIYNK